MTTERDGMNLNDLLDEARALRALPSDTLLARVLADAATSQPRATLSAADLPDRGPARRSRLAAVLGAFGGWPAFGGLAASTALGVVLGVAQPAAIDSLAASFWGEPVSVTLAGDEDLLAPFGG